jgi:hypothetical protein
MIDLTLTNNTFNRVGIWNNAISYTPSAREVHIFDQNGYDLTDIERLFSLANDTEVQLLREYKVAIKQPWFTQPYKVEGAVLNHSFLFERKGYGGAALEQLKSWAEQIPLFHKIISIRPKWGLDFSMDYADREGNAFEVMHWEYDGFSCEEIESIKLEIEQDILNRDWDDAGRRLLKHKSDWHHLGFFEQSDWKCNYFGFPKERFKMVIWK